MSLLAMKIEKLLVNEKVTAPRQTNASLQHYFKCYKQVLTTCYANEFSKTTVSILQVCPSVPPSLFAVLITPSFNALNGYLYVSPNLVTVPTLIC